MRRAGLPPRSSRACHIFNREGILRPLFFEEGVESGLGDGFVDLRLGAAGGDAAHGLAVDLDGEAADRKSTRLHSSHDQTSYAGFSFEKKRVRDEVIEFTRACAYDRAG